MKPIILAILFVASPAKADPQRLSVEQDPLAYAFNGWDVMVAYQHPALPHVRATLAVYGADWPGTADGFTDHQTAITTKLQYFPSEGGRGLMVGAQFAFGKEDYTYTMTPGHQSLDVAIVRAIAGYRWFPFGRGLFIYPWGGVGVRVPVKGDREIMIDNHRTTVGYFSPVLTFHVGYEVTF